MKLGWDATRRNRNSGTAKQGHGQDNKLVMPRCGASWNRYYESLTHYAVAFRTIHSRQFSFIVEQTRSDACHACTVDDIAYLLQSVPSADLDGIELIILRQPKRKEEILRPVWGRWVRLVEIGQYCGGAIMLEALNISRPMRWSKSLTPESQEELERLRADGHAIKTTKHYHLIPLSLESVRATQLYRTVLHEIGHSVDNQLDPVSFDRKTSLEKETFAHQYADRLREKLERFGVLPFERLLDPKRIAQDGLSISDFTVS